MYEGGSNTLSMMGNVSTNCQRHTDVADEYELDFYVRRDSRRKKLKKKKNSKFSLLS